MDMIRLDRILCLIKQHVYWFFYGVLGLFLGYLIEGFGLGKIFIGFALVSIVVILFTKINTDDEAKLNGN